MQAILHCDKNWGIGKRNDLMFNLPKDMKFFRTTTLGKVVVMGSNTLLSFPGGKPLKNRTNIVLWPGGDPQRAKDDGYIMVESLPDLFSEISKYKKDEVFVIGGAMMYHTMLPYCDRVYLTKVDTDGGAEVFFDNLDKLDNWSMVQESEPEDDNGYQIRFTVYENSKPQPLFQEIKNSILEKIKAYNRIIIARHIRPDGDAIGSAHGLARILRLSFPEKQIIVADEDNTDFLSFLDVEESDPETVDYKDALGIVLDTGNIERISNKHIFETEELIKIDHHINNTPYGDISWVEEKRSSASELITEFLFTFRDVLRFDQKVALLLYTGIITDCGNFKYDCTTGDTLRYSAFLLDTGFDLSTLHANLELESFSFFKFQAHVFEKMKITENGVAYIYVDKEMQQRFDLSRTQQSNSVDMLDKIRGSLIWMAFIDNPDKDIRVRLRSRFVTISDLAQKYGGGGHANAAGATVHSIEEMKALVKDADELLKNFKANHGGWL